MRSEINQLLRILKDGSARIVSGVDKLNSKRDEQA
jgi:hypothetical protein